MRLILVRHGQTDWNLKHLMQGMTDIPLDETGKMQAFNVKEKLKNVKLDICFSSPLSRAIETAKDLFARASDLLNDIKEKYSDKTVLVVSHGATIRALHYIITGYDEKTNFLEMKIPNCSILEYEI